MSQISQLTLRGFDPRVAAEIRRLAREMHVSLNQAAQLLLKKGAGVADPRTNPRRVGAALDRFFGTWSPQEARKVGKALEAFEKVDEELWR